MYVYMHLWSLFIYEYMWYACVYVYVYVFGRYPVYFLYFIEETVLIILQQNDYFANTPRLAAVCRPITHLVSYLRLTTKCSEFPKSESACISY